MGTFIDHVLNNDTTLNIVYNELRTLPNNLTAANPPPPQKKYFDYAD